ncbi:hypothetical protein HS088_TW15G00982 [Tripterygium wilfordii]|uniref:Uncharacterized protein n=1 Tax=Tripterygium wilfordii TaxID=458696 RepID=A0A7J7CMY4_TRIWF|nr:hypothetical protein HS088_TW15G00982 [Tripterygium wilfordii]
MARSKLEKHTEVVERDVFKLKTSVTRLTNDMAELKACLLSIRDSIQAIDATMSESGNQGRNKDPATGGGGGGGGEGSAQRPVYATGMKPVVPPKRGGVIKRIVNDFSKPFSAGSGPS